MDTLDLVAILAFAVAWSAYAFLTDFSRFGRNSISAVMNRRRSEWMLVMALREVRMVDTAIITGLQQGSAFFASASLLAIGGGLTLFGATSNVVALSAELTFLPGITALQWHIKVALLTTMFVYAFFKFAWSYRLFNYCSILIGATPVAGRGDPAEAVVMAERAARMNMVAGGHFNRGMRALFFAVPVIGWLFSPWAFMAATAVVLFVVCRRQFFSHALEAARDLPPPAA